MGLIECVGDCVGLCGTYRGSGKRSGGPEKVDEGGRGVAPTQPQARCVGWT